MWICEKLFKTKNPSHPSSEDNRDERYAYLARYHSASCFHALICTPLCQPLIPAKTIPASMLISITGEPVLTYFFPGKLAFCLYCQKCFSRKLQGQFTAASLPSCTPDGSLTALPQLLFLFFASHMFNLNIDSTSCIVIILIISLDLF